VDYYLRPKLAYYAIKQCLAPVTVAAKCVVHENPRDPYTRVGIDRESRVYVWASNLRLTPLHSKLQIKAFDVTNGEQIYQRTEDAVVLQENRSTELTDFLLPTTTKIGEDTNRVVVAVYMLDLTGTQIARFVLWPEILKYVKVQKPKHLKVEFTGDCVSASAEVPVKGLTFEEDGAVFEDNLIDLVPGETVSVKVKGLDGQRNKMAVRYYGM
jgi:beta-mannosidase